MEYPDLLAPLIRSVLLTAYSITILVIVIIIILENRSPLKTISWTLVLLLLPGIGIVFYIFFGQNLRKEKIIARKGLKNHEILSSIALSQIRKLSNGDLFENRQINDKRKIITLLLNNSNSIVTHGNGVKVLNNGSETFDSIIKTLQAARHFIHLEYYIFADDEIGREIIAILKEKASQGVEVRMIVDDVGSWELKNKFFNEMRTAGIEIESFLQVRFPLFTSKVNYRNHRKIIIVDGQIGFLGGINVADRYIKGDKSYGIWRDMHLKLQGDAVSALQTVFLTDWYFVSQEEITDPRYFSSQKPVSDKLVQITASGPDSDHPAIMMGFFQAITSAQDYVYVATPYFMPSESILLALKTAAMGGVDVRIIIPEKSDAYITLYCSRSYIKEMIESGVKFYFYQKGFLHSKMLVIDDIVASIGSTNMDFRSFEQNFEVNAFVFDEEIAVDVRKTFIHDLKDSRQINMAEWKKRPKTKKMKESFARLFSPLL
ncbi:cardiolipin synthase [Marinilabiliaceae bacterium JC017]|nr:cardiolipin synthase [Marinilabiliaceae bacterium JC017]